MQQVEPYNNFVKAMLNGGLLQPADIKNKQALIIGRYTVEGLAEYTETVIKRFLLDNGASSCFGYGMFPAPPQGGSGSDDYGALEELPSKVQDKFDLIFLVEGLEKAKKPALAIKAVMSMARDNATVVIMTRTPKITDTSIKVNYYEDYWRYSSDDLKNIFKGFPIDAVVTTADDYFAAIKLRNKLPLTFHEFLVYSNREKNYISADRYNGGYFADYVGLDALGDLTRTDKCAYDHNYCEKYEFFLNKFRDQKIKLLELGIFGGSSLEMWKKYFTQAKIFGVDIEPDCRAYADDRINIIIGDLSKQDCLAKLAALKPDIVIDDASHFWSHQIKGLFTLFSALPHGGIYIIEDMETSVNQELYSPAYRDFPMSAYEVCSRIARVVAGKDNSDTSEFKDKINEIGMAVEMISIIKGSCIMIKR